MSAPADLARPFPGLQESGAVFRSVAFGDFVDIELRAAGDGSLREFDGIAVPYNKEVDIDGWFYETWTGSANSGPFDRQLRAANRVKVGYRHIMLGGDLIGALREMSNDSKGLRITGKISPGVPAGDSALALMADRALDELSIGFYRVAGGDVVTRDAEGRPHIEMLRAQLFEVALEPFGAYGRNSTVTAVRSAGGAIEDDGDRVRIMLGKREIASYRLRDLAGEVGPEPIEPEPAEDEVPAVPALLRALPPL